MCFKIEEWKSEKGGIGMQKNHAFFAIHQYARCYFLSTILDLG